MLDMRMEAHGPSAADVVAAASERTLADIIFLLGEERHSRAVARAIVRARAEAPIRTTAALADIVGRVVRRDLSFDGQRDNLDRGEYRVDEQGHPCPRCRSA